MIQQFCFLVGIPINQSDIDYIVGLNLVDPDIRTTNLLLAIEHIFLKNEGLQLLTNNDLMPFLTGIDNIYDPSTILEKNKLYNSFIDIMHDDINEDLSHGLSFYYYNEDYKNPR